MADVNQTIVEPTRISSPDTYGDRNGINLRSAYPESPIYTGDLSDEERKAFYTSLLSTQAAEGLGVNSFDPDYSNNGAPDVGSIEEVKSNTGGVLPIGQGAGAPTNPFVPPLTSPGKGNFTADEQAPWTGAPVKATTLFGSGMNPSLQAAQPKTSAENIEKLTIGQAMTMGRSYPGSDGKSS